jgi:hypothetical protein
MSTPPQAERRNGLILTCGCLTGIMSICLICSAVSGLILRPDLFGLESTLAELGLAGYDYDSLRARFTGATATPSPPTERPTPRPTDTPLPTSTFTPIPTFTPTLTPTETATVPPTDTPSPLTAP